jgi:hypothetical protein
MFLMKMMLTDVYLLLNICMLITLYELLFAINECEISPLLLENVALRMSNLQIENNSAVVSNLRRVV